MPPSSRQQIVRPATYIRFLAVAASTRMQKLISFGSESLPTLALFTFLVLQFLFNIVRFLPSKSLKLWVDRCRLLWKILLDHDFRVEHTELQTLRKRVADGDSKYSRIEKDLDVSKSNSFKLRERLVSQTQQLESERQGNARELERLRNQLETQFKLLEETEAHLNELRASSNHRLSRVADDASIGVYFARITALETRLDQLEGENEETGVRYREVVAENAALREQLTEVEALKTDAHSLIQEMRSRLIAAEAHSQEFTKDQGELQALVHALEAEKTGLLQAKKTAEEHEEHEIAHEKSMHAQQVDSLMQEMDSLRARYEELDGLATRLRSQLDASSNEHADFKANAEQEHTTDQDALSESTRRVHELEQALKDGAAKSEGLQRELNLKNDELTHMRELLDEGDNGDVKRTRSIRRPQQPSPPHTLPAAPGLHPHPTNPFGFIAGGSPSRAWTASETGHAKQRSVSGSSMSGSIRGRDQDRANEGVPVPSTTETPPSPESPPATKAKRSKRRTLGSLFGVHIGHHHHHHGSEDPGPGSGSGSGSGAGDAAGPLGGIRQVS